MSIGTIRLICVTRGRPGAAIILGFFEVLVWILAVSTVLAHLNHWTNILAYAGGFAAGSALGMWLEHQLAIGTQVITFLSRGSGQAVAERLRYAEVMVTTLNGSGREGPVAVCVAVVPRKQVQVLIKMAKEIDPNVLVTIEDVRQTTARQPSTLLTGKSPAIIAGRWNLRR